MVSRRVVAPPKLELPNRPPRPVPVTVTNTGRLPWDSRAIPPMLLSYHWLQADGDRFVTFEGVRTPFASPVPPERPVTVAVQVRAAAAARRYRLEWDVVQEGRLWFSTEPGAVRTMSRATVTVRRATRRSTTTPPPRPTVGLDGWCCGAPRRGCSRRIR